MAPLTLPKFAFFGTPGVAYNTLELLAACGTVPALVVTNPPAPKGRGLALVSSEVSSWAYAHSLPTLTPNSFNNEINEKIRSYGCDFAIVVAYGKIFPIELISLFPKGVINVHYSLLPKYRGASPVETALKNGDAFTGVSIQRMVRALDAGDVLISRKVSINPLETVRELRPRLIAVGVDLLSEILPDFVTGKCIGTPQEESEVTFAPKIKKDNGCLSLTGNSTINWNTYRAYIEGPGTFFFATRGEKRIRVKIIAATYTNKIFVPTRVVPEGKSEQSYNELTQAQWVIC